MPDIVGSPFAALSLIVAPAILTNASSVLAMSTSNRLARAVARARELARQLESSTSSSPDDGQRRLHELTVSEHRSVLLLRALRSFYWALGAFSSATLLSLVGAVTARTTSGPAVRVLEIVALITGALAVSALVHGSALLLRETGLAVAVMQERIEILRSRNDGADR